MEGSPDPRTDGELLVATGADPAAFAVFYSRHVRGVLPFFRRRVDSAEVAFDLPRSRRNCAARRASGEHVYRVPVRQNVATLQVLRAPPTNPQQIVWYGPHGNVVKRYTPPGGSG